MTKPDILIHNADHVLTMDDTRAALRGADILIRGGVIVAIGTGLAAQHPGAD
ncbi:MAG: 8-oxoguanine deaminase, partial [Paracoccaceae bacterium]